MTSKLTWHFQSIPSWAPGIVNASWVKIMDPPADNPFPGKKVIGRVYVPDGEANALVMQGAAGADAWYARCLPIYQRSPWVHCWEGPNEPPVGEPGQRVALVAFTRRWNELMHAAGRKTVALCLSVGWPAVGTAGELAGALETADFWAVHEYSAPTLRDQETWLCLRYRRTIAELRTAGARVPPLLITEFNFDGGVCGQSKKSWKTFCNGDRAAALNAFAWYDNEIQRDPEVVCATLFTSGPMGWDDFDIDEPLSQLLATYITNSGTIEPPPPPEEEPVDYTILDAQGNERDLAWLTARGYLAPTVTQPTAQGFRLIALQEELEAADLHVTVQNEDGTPFTQLMAVGRWWSGLIVGEPNTLILPDNIITTPGPNTHDCLALPLDRVTGEVGFGIGGGDYYNSGAHNYLSVPTNLWPSVRVDSPGWWNGQNGSHSGMHRLIIRLMGGTEPPPPPVEGTVIGYLDAADSKLAAITGSCSLIAGPIQAVRDDLAAARALLG